MKNTNKKHKKVAVKDLAEQFANEFNKQLPVTILPDGGIVYKKYVVRQLKTGNWALYNHGSKSVIEEYYLKTCALMAAKAYNSLHLTKFFEIKQLDNHYWANHSDLQVYKKNIKTVKEFDRYIILLNKLEDTEYKTEHFKEKISRMFKWSFV